MTLTRPPSPVGPSPWEGFPVAERPGGAPVALGGDLAPTTVVGAYREGIFPWPLPDADLATAAARHGLFARALASGLVSAAPAGDATGAGGIGDATGAGGVRPARGPRRRRGTRRARPAGAPPMPWWSPDPRAVLPVDGVHRARSLRRRLRNCGWSTTLNAAFAEVVRHCARTGEAGEAHGDGPGGGHGDEDAWITPELAAAYQELHELGWAHSIEVWDGDELVGGMYGVLVGAAGMLESMFHVRTDASKVALVDFVDRFAAAGGTLLDVQFVTPHLESLGALEVPRADYLARLREARDAEVRLETERLPVARLAPFGGR